MFRKWICTVLWCKLYYVRHIESFSSRKVEVYLCHCRPRSSHLYYFVESQTKQYRCHFRSIIHTVLLKLYSITMEVYASIVKECGKSKEYKNVQNPKNRAMCCYTISDINNSPDFMLWLTLYLLQWLAKVFRQDYLFYKMN